MVNFLKRTDYYQSIREEHLDDILDSSLDQFLEAAEDAALSEMQLYLRGNFDLAILFPTIRDWSPVTEYLCHSYVWYDFKIYQAKQDVTPSGSNGSLPPETDTEFWKLNDPRDPFLKQTLIDIVLHNIHKTISPREIPKHRLIAYDQAIYKLKMLRDGELSSDLPTIENPMTSPTITGDERNTWFF